MSFAGGGDSALDWSIILSDIAAEVVMIHRRTSFRGALDSVEKSCIWLKMEKFNSLQIQAMGLGGEGKLEFVAIEGMAKPTYPHKTDYFLPLFGLAPSLDPSPIGIGHRDNAVKVDTFDYSTNLRGVYAIGDVQYISGKLKLILYWFHGATLMVQSAFKHIYPEQNFHSNIQQ